MWVYLYYDNIIGDSISLRNTYDLSENNAIRLRRDVTNSLTFERYNLSSGLYEQIFYNISTGKFDLTTLPAINYYLKTEYINSSSGITDANKPIKTDSNGLLSATFLLAGDVRDKIASLVGASRLSFDSLKDGSVNVGYTPTEKSKLSGIEALADVTDAINVAAAGAVMSSSLVTVATANSPVKTLASGLIDPSFVGNNYTKEPTGFSDRTSSAISWNDSTPDRTFTITGTNFVVFSAGRKVLKNTEPIQITNFIGLHWIYYNNDGSFTLTDASDAPAFDSGAILIATAYWNGTKGLIGDERHGLAESWVMHEYLHKTVGSRYESGYTGTFTNTTLSITRGYFWDEDIRHDSLATITQVPIFYRVGSVWDWTTLQNTVHYIDSGNVQYDNAGTLTPATNNYYVAYWVFATNNPTYPIISIMGQRQDQTIANARANNTYESLSFGTLPFAEMKLLYRVIVRNDATPYEETQDLRSVSNLSSGTYVATDHGVLTGLTDDDHTQYQLRSETNNINCGRLCLASATPDTIDQTASATLYWTPYKGNVISLLVGGVNVVKTFTEQTIDISALTADKNYDIFAYYDSTTDTVKIEALAWSTDTARATALTLVNGIYYKSGDTTRKYLGTIRTISSTGTKCVDSANYRYVDNCYNKIKKPGYAECAAYYTYATSAWREFNGGTSMLRFNCVAGLARKFIAQINSLPRSQGGVDNLYYNIAFALNSTSTPYLTSVLSTSPRFVSLIANHIIVLSAGFNYLTGLEKTDFGTVDIAGAYNRIFAEIDC